MLEDLHARAFQGGSSLNRNEPLWGSMMWELGGRVYSNIVDHSGACTGHPFPPPLPPPPPESRLPRPGGTIATAATATSIAEKRRLAPGHGKHI
eukprot:9476294-Pyramimonas_sp.AAC.1